jgi:uncharacterized protein
MHASTTQWAMQRPRLTLGLCVAFALAAATVAVLPSVWPDAFPLLHPARVDTDPENMLPVDEPVRVFHNRMQEVFDLHEMVVVGIVNEQHPDGVFTPASLGRIHELTTFARTLRWEDRARPGEMRGVVSVDVIAPGTVDSMEPGGPGEVRFEWLMPEAPRTTEEALAVRAKAMRIPFLNGTMVSENGKALCPVPSGHFQGCELPRFPRRYARRWRSSVATTPCSSPACRWRRTPSAWRCSSRWRSRRRWPCWSFSPHAGVLPQAAARRYRRCSWPCCLGDRRRWGVLIAFGATPVHIMSSMIPIFIMPIAVLDSVPYLSEFFDRYRPTVDRKAHGPRSHARVCSPQCSTRQLTSMAGFASLAL